MMKLVVVLVIIMGACGSIGADECGCGGEDKVVGPSFKVHGRYSIWSGNPTGRIWVVGTKRMIGIREGTPLPKNLDALLDDFDTEVYADFVLCPLTKFQPGVMQVVCVSSATHLVKWARGTDPISPEDVEGCYAYNSDAADTICFESDNTYTRRYKGYDGQQFEDSGSWKLQILGQPGTKPYAEIVMPAFVSRFADTCCDGGKEHLILRDHHVANSEPAPTRIRIWKEKIQGYTHIKLGNHIGLGWNKE